MAGTARDDEKRVDLLQFEQLQWRILASGTVLVAELLREVTFQEIQVL